MIIFTILNYLPETLEKKFSTGKRSDCRALRVSSVLDQELGGRKTLRTVTMEGTLEIITPSF